MTEEYEYDDRLTRYYERKSVERTFGVMVKPITEERQLERSTSEPKSLNIKGQIALELIELEGADRVTTIEVDSNTYEKLMIVETEMLIGWIRFAGILRRIKINNTIKGWKFKSIMKTFVREKKAKILKVANDRILKENFDDMKQEVENIRKELDATELLLVVDAYVDDEWLEEIWDETDLGFPERDNNSQRVIHNKDYFCSVWDIDVPGIGRGILSQDASPIGIYFKKEDLLASNYELEYIN